MSLVLDTPTCEIGTGPAPVTAEEYADLIRSEWRKSVEGIVGAGRWLIRAKEDLEHGQLGELYGMLPFSARTAQMLMQVAANPRIANAKHATRLPASWYTFYELARLTEEQWAVIEPHVRPDMTRGEIGKLLAAPAAAEEPFQSHITHFRCWADWNYWRREIKPHLPPGVTFTEPPGDAARLKRMRSAYRRLSPRGRAWLYRQLREGVVRIEYARLDAQLRGEIEAYLPPPRRSS